jgi:hypothetical protein
MRKLLQSCCVLVLVLSPACAKPGSQDPTVSQSLGQAGLRFYEGIGHAGKLVQALERAEVIETRDALVIQEAFLQINTAQGPFTAGLRRLDRLEQEADPGERVKVLLYVVESLGMVAAEVDLVLTRIDETDPETAEVRQVLQAARDALLLIRLGVQPWLREGVA